MENIIEALFLLLFPSRSILKANDKQIQQQIVLEDREQVYMYILFWGIPAGSLIHLLPRQSQLPYVTRALPNCNGQCARINAYSAQS